MFAIAFSGSKLALNCTHTHTRARAHIHIHASYNAQKAQRSTRTTERTLRAPSSTRPCRIRRPIRPRPRLRTAVCAPAGPVWRGVAAPPRHAESRTPVPPPAYAWSKRVRRTVFERERPNKLGGGRAPLQFHHARSLSRSLSLPPRVHANGHACVRVCAGRRVCLHMGVCACALTCRRFRVYAWWYT